MVTLNFQAFFTFGYHPLSNFYLDCKEWTDFITQFAFDLLPIYSKHFNVSLLLPLCFLSRIYKLQQEGQAFKDVASLLSALSKDMLRMTQVSTTDWLMEKGLSPQTINELVMSVVQCNYGQTPAMHALVGECFLLKLILRLFIC